MHCSSTNIDEIELAETFKTRIDLGERKPQYEHVEWSFISDQNNKNYKKPIEFITTEWKDKNPIYREGYAVFPLRVESSDATPYDANTILAWKASVLTLIRSLKVKTVGSGPTFINSNDGGLPLQNNLKLLTCSDLDWVNCTGPELSFFGPDREVGKPGSVISVKQHLTAFPSNDMIGNQQLSDRVTIFAQESNRIPATDFEMIVCIPLKYIHPFFDQLGFPLPNCPLQITFGLASVSNGESELMPLTTASKAVHGSINAAGTTLAAAAAINAASVPELSIDDSITFRGFTPGACRLYVKCVTLKPADQKKMDAEMSGSGYKKIVTYTTTDFYRLRNVDQTLGGRRLHHVFGQETKRPVRVWALFTKPDAMSDATSTFPATIGQTLVKNVNLKINGAKFRSEDFESQLELYNELRAYMLGSGYSSTQGAQISYNDFVHGMNPYLFDLSRHPTVRNNLPITFTFDGELVQLGADAKCDAIFLVERYKTAVFNIMHNKIHVTDEDGLSYEPERS